MILNAIIKQRMQWAEKRFNLFCNAIQLSPNMKILDLGGYDGSYMDMLKCKFPNLNITIADLDEKALKIAALKGYETIILDGSDTFPFKEKEFDYIFCNSVIEHVTIPKARVWDMKNTKQFEKQSLISQSIFANEISRCSKMFFIQTPYKFFPIESHTWFPNITILPRNLQLLIIKGLNRFWIKKTNPDWHLLTIREMKNLFPNSTIVVNKIFGFPKDIIAIKKLA